jgi:hypothetical protein
MAHRHMKLEQTEVVLGLIRVRLQFATRPALPALPCAMRHSRYGASDPFQAPPLRMTAPGTQPPFEYAAREVRS